MKHTYVAKTSISISASIEKVWEALVTPSIIKQYLFGTEVTSDWKEDSTITYTGVWKGKSYEDKGKILTFVPNKEFTATYWSSMSGTEDKPENYAIVSYILKTKDRHVELTVTQDNILNEAAQKDSKKNWGMVLGTIKKIVEEK